MQGKNTLKKLLALYYLCENPHEFYFNYKQEFRCLSMFKSMFLEICEPIIKFVLAVSCHVVKIYFPPNG